MVDTFLTDEELESWTGYKLPSAQARWLEREGVPFRLTRLGHPRVWREIAQQFELGTGAFRHLARKPPGQPDFTAMRERRNGQNA